ncbi:uncharacterized protein LOC115750436 isoform X2 [Rhodamnia argentea]|uniref:Uncharacterized protein LOC115750436 isoform X2 n=1 Tax=Rhodamnia argentea TaxID=178133 RepID=A0A8B8Q977_9MYRT|nr:uncharacterized protein LOC115750436 isoform X2 [Rhodamnia argentea]
MEDRPPAKEDVSPATAVLLGALAPGVNGPTWNALKMAFVMLGGSLAVMMGLAFSSSDSWLTLHVSFLVIITLALFLLLSCLIYCFSLPHRMLASSSGEMQDLSMPNVL